MAALSLLVLVLLYASSSFANNLTLTLLSSYPEDSACLDGSPYGYYYRPGNETNKWIIHHQGGGWCYDLADCAGRALGGLGSSKSWAPSITSWGGLLFDQEQYNPDFYNWTVVILYYCDGSSFSGYRADPVPYGNQQIYFRGKNNLLAASNDLLQNKNLNKATDVIITGCSAGGLSTYLHLDYWRSVIPTTATVKGIADAGWFLDTLSVYGYSIYTPEMQTGFALWNSSGGVNEACVAAHVATNDTWKCIFAEYTYPHIQTPIFMVNSKYDSWQIPFIYDLPCYSDINKCNSTEITQFLSYGATYLSTLPPIEQAPKDGMWVDACYFHCQTIGTTWTSIIVETADGTKVSANMAFANWYFGRTETKAVDTCAYPCNPTC